MRFYVLSELSDVVLGLRMAGMEGEVVQDAATFEATLARLSDDPEIGVIVDSEGLTRFSPQLLTQWKLKKQRPLLVEIPERGGSSAISQTITDYIVSTIGIRID